jgi:hypothetical protein
VIVPFFINFISFGSYRGIPPFQGYVFLMALLTQGFTLGYCIEPLQGFEFRLMLFALVYARFLQCALECPNSERFNM